MDRPRDAAHAGPDVRLGQKDAAADERLVRAVVVREVEVAVKRDRVRDRQVVRLVAAAGVGAMSNEPPQREDDEGLKGAALPHASECTGTRPPGSGRES